MEIEGQRPRHLTALHIAALKGHTDLVEYLVNLGVSVNLQNNKNDTPILWAARWNHGVRYGRHYVFCVLARHRLTRWRVLCHTAFNVLLDATPSFHSCCYDSYIS